ncbi:MAG TPA: ABC transporter permease [Thermoclostridium sp.]
MFVLLKSELTKIKRYRLIYAGILLMLLSVVLTMITTTAQDGRVWDYQILYEQVIQQNMTMIFPMTITLIIGYIINREIRDDTLKNLITVPVKYSKILGSKLLLGCILSLIYGAFSWFFTLIAYKLLGFDGLTVKLFFKSFFQITVFNLFLYIGISPLIAITAKSGINHLMSVILAFVFGYAAMFVSGNKLLVNIYPVTAGGMIIGFRNHVPAVKEMANPVLAAVSLTITLLITMFIVKSTNEIKSARKNEAKVKLRPKKGW